MDTLSSCYFCGAALDKRLQEYPVVPESLRDDDDVTRATLCPACHQKLDTVLDAVVEAVDEAQSDTTGDTPPITADTTVSDTDESGQETLDSGGNTDESLPHGEATAETTADDFADESEEPSDDNVTAEDVATLAEGIDSGILVDEDDEELETDDGRSDIEEWETAEPVEGDTDEATDGSETNADETGSSDDAVTAEDVDALAGDIDSDILDERDDGGDEEDELQSAMEPDVPTEFQSGGDAVEDPVEGDEVAAESTGAGESDDISTAGGAEPDQPPAGESASARPSISALEYNKVMRLLQNREFPVDREEIETVAANAYGLSQDECAAVIDLAVDRGLIDEDGDRLVRSE